MANLQWYTILLIVIILFSSGAIGAFIYAAISLYRNKKQVIASRVDVFPTFEDTFGASGLRTYITISDGQKEYQYEELQTVQIELLNQGKQDFNEFKFGIALSSGDVAVYVEAQSPDRHHQLEQVTPISFTEPKSEIDFILHSFNRKDSYLLRLLVVTSEKSKPPGDIKFSSPEAIRFVDLPTSEELIKKVAPSTSLALGPFNISFDE